MGTLLEGGRLELRNEPEVATPPPGATCHFVATDGPAVPLPRCQARELGEARTGLTASQPVSPLSPLEREPRCAVCADLQLPTHAGGAKTGRKTHGLVRRITKSKRRGAQEGRGTPRTAAALSARI